MAHVSHNREDKRIAESTTPLSGFMKHETFLWSLSPYRLELELFLKMVTCHSTCGRPRPPLPPPACHVGFTEYSELNKLSLMTPGSILDRPTEVSNECPTHHPKSYQAWFLIGPESPTNRTNEQICDILDPFPRKYEKRCFRGCLWCLLIIKEILFLTIWNTSETRKSW